MQTHYYNAFYDDDESFRIESSGLTYDEAIEDIIDYDLPYAYTLEVGLEETRIIDLESIALNKKHEGGDDE